jgi:hypothetical protein
MTGLSSQYVESGYALQNEANFVRGSAVTAPYAVDPITQGVAA